MDNDGYDSDHVSVRDVATLSNADDDSASSLLTSSDEENEAGTSNQEEGNAGPQLRSAPSSRNTFNSTLPVLHSYLGEDLEELHGRTVLEEGTVMMLPLLPQSGLILVPGQTFPLSVSYPETVKMLCDVIDADRTFGVVGVRSEAGESSVSEVGTTAEIYAYRAKTSETGRSLRIKARGRQRFRVLEVERHSPGHFQASVLILPEVILPDPLQEIAPPSTRRHRHTRRRDVLATRHAAMTPWPRWVYDMYDADRLVARMKQALKHLEEEENDFHIPSDPVELSYWVCQTLPIPDDQRIALLSMDSAIQRLQTELATLENFQMICCQNCGRQIADKSDVFSMSAEGPQGTYVNPDGYVHETMTLHRANGLVIQTARPSYQYSWFQGYGWTIVQCRTCGSHMGWLFTTTKQKLHPKSFFGLCRRSLVIKTVLRPAKLSPTQPSMQPSTQLSA